ncbi:MAG: hypothetical protein HZC48_09565 [Nitrospirae bacterium]|nr:hypothetical protein [Nitrospirota bacterium]
MNIQTIYLNKVNEAIHRLGACDSFLAQYQATNNIYSFEAAVLQARKSLEAIAFAAIAPNKIEYAVFRAEADKSADYRKDYNARAILQHLGRINKDFYPTPLKTPTRKIDGSWHFERKTNGYLTKQQFISFYDRLGKYLHADNPWGNSKGIHNLVADFPQVLGRMRGLLELHFTVIRTQKFNGIWIVEAQVNGATPRVVVGHANGDFIVQREGC